MADPRTYLPTRIRPSVMDESQEFQPWPSSATYLFLGFVALAVGTRPDAAVNVLYAALGVGLIGFAARSYFGSSRSTHSFDPDAALGVAAMLLVFVGGVDSRLIPLRGGLSGRVALPVLTGLLLAILMVAYVAVRSRTSRLGLVGGVVVLLTIPIGWLAMSASPSPPIDVWLIHAAAAEALADSMNPYSDAVVVADTSPTALPGDEIVGYSYPPVTLVAYAVGHWVGGDSRWTSLVAWFVTVAVMARIATRSGTRTGLGLLVLVAVVVQPAWPYILELACTEPLSLALVAVSILWWKDRPTGSAVMLGLAIASKQFFVLALPLLVFMPDEHRNRRVLIAGGVAAATILPFAVLDPGAFWRSVVTHHLARPPRPDASNLVGLLASIGVDWNPPSLLSIGVPLLLGVSLGRRVRGPGGFLVALALVLSAFFLLGTGAFPNYWFFVAGLVAIAALLSICRPAGGLPAHRPDAAWIE